MIEIYAKQVEDRSITLFDVPSNLVDKVKMKIIEDGFSINLDGSVKR